MTPLDTDSETTGPSATAQKLLRAVELHQQGQLQAADGLYQEVLSLEPNNPDALHFFGVLRWHQGQPQTAVDFISRSIMADPDNPGAYYNRGNALADLRRYEEAVQDFVKAIALQPDFVEALVNHGTALQNLGRHAEALESHERALRIRPDYVDAQRNRGIALQTMGRHEEAVASYDLALAALPGDPMLLTNRAVALEALDRTSEASATLDQPAADRSDDPVVHNNRGVTLHRLGRYSDALRSFDRALALRPDYAEAHNHRGAVLVEFREFDRAVESYDRALGINPNLAAAQFNKSLLKLLLGDFEAGWELYEWRWRKPDNASQLREFTEPLWLGRTSLQDKTILIYAEQGFGDFIQFCRYVPLLESRGARVVLEVPPELRTLAATLSPSVRVVVQGEPLPAFDFQCPIMTLALAFNTTLDSVPAEVPYLRADPALTNAWRVGLGPRKTARFGIVWSGNRRQRNDRNRSVPLAALQPLLATGAEFHCLQKEIRAEDEAFLGNSPIQVHCQELDDFAATAALIGEMDLVITVDTAVAHLAGALGKPVWILLPYSLDFRWLTPRTDSPWYPTARLFRQATAGDWHGVIAEVVRALKVSPGFLDR